ncbi:HPr family phosphocarrier protein [Bacillus haimaensis]|uniref:HPr family phosphocarrier protein n=1 Tax=Bacillus haimaensis TaxID=3160967 RepID=UPI003AA929D6
MMVTKQIIVTLTNGLHSKTAQSFVRKALAFQSDIKVVRHNKMVDGKSLLGLLSLGIATGNVVTVKAEGLDEKEAVSILTSFLKNEIDVE